MGSCELEALEPIEARDGVDADVEADMTDIGREGKRDPGEEIELRSTGRSSTSIESMKSRLLLNRFAWSQPDFLMILASEAILPGNRPHSSPSNTSPSL